MKFIVCCDIVCNARSKKKTISEPKKFDSQEPSYKERTCHCYFCLLGKFSLLEGGKLTRVCHEAKEVMTKLS